MRREAEIAREERVKERGERELSGRTKGDRGREGERERREERETKRVTLRERVISCALRSAYEIIVGD